MEHKIGEIFQYNDEGNIVNLQVVLDNGPTKEKCVGCFFHNSVRNKCCKEGTILGWCMGRKDGNYVKFIQINNTMEEKRNIQISLEEAREWYNSDDSFKKELALKAYSKEELELSYSTILNKLSANVVCKNTQKHIVYLKLINTASYLNSITPVEFNTAEGDAVRFYYTIDIHKFIGDTYYKGFAINKIVCYPNTHIASFNSEEAAKKAIDILGDELKILFE